MKIRKRTSRSKVRPPEQPSEGQEKVRLRERPAPEAREGRRSSKVMDK